MIPSLQSTFRSFRHRNFRLFFVGQLISVVGTWMQSVAQAWLIYRMTNSPMLLGITTFAGQFPSFLIAAFGGVVADRYNRHRIIIVTQCSSMILAFILAALTFTGSIQVWHILLLAGLLGVVNAFDIPVRQSFVVHMVGKEDLPNAIALNSTMVNGARIAGPALAGVLVAAVGEGWCFLLNGISYIAVIVGLLLMKLPPWQKAAHPGSPIDNILEGFHYVRRTRPIRAIMLMLALVSLMGAPYGTLMPIFADQIYHHGAEGLGTLMGMSGIGALFGALSLTFRKGVEGLGRLIMLCALGFGVSLILFSQAKIYWMAAAFLIPTGYCMMALTAASNTLLQAMVEDRFRGRVMSFFAMSFVGMAPIGALMAGAIAKSIGAPWTVSIGGAVCFIGGLVFRSQSPRLREEARKILAMSSGSVT